MTNSTIIRDAAKNSTYTQGVFREVLDAVEVELKKAVSSGEEVKVLDVTFKPVVVPEHAARNPRTGESVTVPEHYRFSTKFSSDWKRLAKSE